MSEKTRTKVHVSVNSQAREEEAYLSDYISYFSEKQSIFH